MGDALIVGRGGSSGGSSGKTLVTKIIQATQSWTIPKAKDQKFYVRIFGGGGGGSYGELDTSGATTNSGARGGGGGMMNNGELTLEAGTSIPITIGLGGKAGDSGSPTGSAGGTTSFGTYLAANGGNAYAGGSGGGAGNRQTPGYGLQFGGGGGSAINDAKDDGANGGKWGGGGMGNPRYRIAKGGCLYYDNGVMQKDSNGDPILSGLAGDACSNGTNTIGDDQVPNGSEDKPYYELNLQGNGISGKFIEPSIGYGGGGGYGGNGGIGLGGGGGGYGGNGGNYFVIGNSYSGGGGGGYGANGGDGYLIQLQTSGYYVSWLNMSCGGGGGGYGPSGTGGSYNTGYPDGGIAAGGSGGSNTNPDFTPKEGSPPKTPLLAGRGGNGICIIQYYA